MRPRVSFGSVVGGVFFATIVIGFFWIGTLAGVGAGLIPAAERLTAAAGLR